MEKKYHYFYKITNLINGKFYYGIRSTDIVPEKDSYMGSGIALKQAFKIYGRINFKKDILKLFSTRKDVSDYERKIVTLEIICLEDCYNCRTGGDNEYLRTVTDETRLKLSNANKGKKKPKEFCDKLSVRMKILANTPEYKDRASNINRDGKSVTDETRRKMRENNVGKKHSEETKHKIKAANIGRRHTEESKKKMSDKSWLKGKQVDESFVKKMSSIAKKRPCIIEGVYFESVKSVMMYYDIAYDTVTRRILHTGDKWKNWNYYSGD